MCLYDMSQRRRSEIFQTANKHHLVARRHELVSFILCVQKLSGYFKIPPKSIISTEKIE